MKKIMVLALLIACSLPLFSYSSEWITLGPGIAFNSSSPKSSYESYQSVGLEIVTYGFWNDKQPGIFFVGNINGVIGYERSMWISMILGPSVRYSIGDRVFGGGGVGIAIAETGLLHDSGGDLALDFGIGFDLSMSYKFNKALAITAGYAGSAMVAQLPLIDGYSDTSSGVEFGVFTSNMNPYIGMTLLLNNREGRYMLGE